MKAVMLSIQPKWCELIASGRKTIEVRKTRPKMGTPFKCYIYQTLHREGRQGMTYSDGKVIGEFVCDRIDDYAFDYCTHPEISGVGLNGDGGDNWYEIDEEDLIKTCLSEDELKTYGNRNMLHGWNISDLKIYDKPKSLSEFALNRPPQSWGYVEEVNI